MKKKLLLLAAGLGLMIGLNAQWTTPVSITGASFSWQHQVSTGDGSYYLFDVTRNTPRFMIDGPTGNVGIGTINPSCWFSNNVLEIAGSRPVLKLTTSTDIGTIFFTSTLANATTHIGEFHLNYIFDANDNTKSRIAFGTYPAGHVLNVLSNGSVGIGTTLPMEGYKLDVNGKMRAAYYNLNAYSTNYDDFAMYVTTDVGTTIASAGVTNIAFRTNNTEKMRITAEGSVGIGTSTPNTQYKLDVAGSIRANEIKVNTTGADFVFEPAYKLRPLAEVETFINQHKHLPDVARAAEMQSNGVSVGDMQAKLLQKVEELTLYVIEQNKNISTLQKQVEMLNKENEVLKKDIKNSNK